MGISDLRPAKWLRREIRGEDQSRRVDAEGDATLRDLAAEMQAKDSPDSPALADPRLGALQRAYETVETTFRKSPEFTKMMEYMRLAGRISLEQSPGVAASAVAQEAPARGDSSLSPLEAALADFRQVASPAAEDSRQVLPQPLRTQEAGISVG